MLLEQTNYWATVQAYVMHPPSRLRLFLARAEWLWLEWQAGAELRRQRREISLLRRAELPEYLKRDIGLV